MACSLTQLPPRWLTDSLSGQTRWWDQGCGMPPVGMVSKIIWGQPCRLAACPWELQSQCRGRPKDGSPGCAGSSEVQWQQPGSPKSPDHLKHPYRGGRFKVKLGSWASWQRSGSGTAANVTRAEIKGEVLSLKAALEGRRVETLFSQLFPYSSLAQGHTVVSKAGSKTRQPGPGKEAGGEEVARRALTSSVALPLEIAGYKLLCNIALPFWKQVCQCIC